jgi:hypothetical protein
MLRHDASQKFLAADYDCVDDLLVTRCGDFNTYQLLFQYFSWSLESI